MTCVAVLQSLQDLREVYYCPYCPHYIAEEMGGVVSRAGLSPVPGALLGFSPCLCNHLLETGTLLQDLPHKQTPLTSSYPLALTPFSPPLQDAITQRHVPTVSMSHLPCVQAPLWLLPAQTAPAKASSRLYDAQQPLDLSVPDVLATHGGMRCSMLESCPPWLSHVLVPQLCPTPPTT